MTTLTDAETYWSAEIGESVDINPRGWADYPSDYGLWIGGTFVVAFKRLEEIEDYLSRYFCVTGESIG